MKYQYQRRQIWIILMLITTSFIQGQNITKDTLTIPEIVVTGTRNETNIRHLPMTVSIVSNKQISRRYDTSLLPILTEQVPGLFTTARGIMGYGVAAGGSGGFSTRGIGGSPTTGMLILIDGHPQYMGLMGHSIADAYQTILADKVEIVRGPASMLYGSNAMGGVINILTTKTKQNGWSGNSRISYGSYNTLTSEATLQYRHQKFSSLVTGSYNRTDGHRANMEFEQYGGYAKLAYELTTQWEVFTDLSLTHFNAANPGTITQPIYDNDSHITRGMTSISLENNYNKTSGAVKFFYNWGKHKINDGYYINTEPKDYLFHSNDKMLGVTAYQSISPWKGSRWTGGVDFQKFGGKAKNVFFNGTTTDIINKTVYSIAGYLDYRQNINEFMTFDAGIRVDHHSITGNHLIPQAGISIFPTQNGEIKLIASRGFRNPTIREMYMFPPQNPNLKPESLWNYEVSWSQRLLKNRLSYAINLFHINGKDLIQTIPIDGRPKNVNTGEVKNWGSEISVSYHFSHAFAITANYSWLNMKNKVLAAPEHKLFLGLDYTKNQWNGSTTLQYINGLYTSTDPLIDENYLLWNIRGSFKVNSWLEVFSRIENLLNQKYEINLGFPMPGTTINAGVNLSF